MNQSSKKTREVRDINGIVLINKPLGLSSNAVLQRVKYALQAKKAGHSGTLDPLATGMLPICLGEATKFCQYLLDADKCYEVRACLGIKTSTGDAEGEEIARVNDFVVSLSQLEAVLSRFKGEIQQTPSMYSALKHQGRPLYQYARAGIDIARPARTVMIHQLTLQTFDGVSFALRVVCSKGTYVRNLVEDIGDALGVGAHVTCLHRSYTAGFNDEKMYSLDELEGSFVLLPMERAVIQFPRLAVNDATVFALRQGKTIDNIEDSQVIGCVRLYQNDVHFIGLGDVSSERQLKVRRLLTETVESGT